MEIFTIGHSTHSKEAFTSMLKSFDIQLLADVRAFPGSRKFPQFSQDHLPNWLQVENIDYQHFKKLGGRRPKSQEVDPALNGGWRNRFFHNYADYTLSDSFAEGIEKLIEEAVEKPVAYCCAERHPARCHRLLISNWLTANGWDVHHIIDGPKGKIDVVKHELGQWGATPLVQKDKVIYPETN
ncbi:DUF488 domain-containing protein [Lederbergia lenta]|uniref:DUF488 domain-containing protein n=1 Tax=Lederbergia lenta TaxID=1467 RepID=UPI00203BCD12|nr:DUF488 domain-containing protein [Lederbergia lenta]MCM3112489.1 DUF488 domain-containing protein [Lederbergia lenta]